MAISTFVPAATGLLPSVIVPNTSPATRGEAQSRRGSKEIPVFILVHPDGATFVDSACIGINVRHRETRVKEAPGCTVDCPLLLSYFSEERSMSILIRNGRVVSTDLDEVTDIF